VARLARRALILCRDDFGAVAPVHLAALHHETHVLELLWMVEYSVALVRLGSRAEM
jgi:hypothetical protein